MRPFFSHSLNLQNVKNSQNLVTTIYLNLNTLDNHYSYSHKEGVILKLMNAALIRYIMIPLWMFSVFTSQNFQFCAFKDMIVHLLDSNRNGLERHQRETELYGLCCELVRHILIKLTNFLGIANSVRIL